MTMVGESLAWILKRWMLKSLNEPKRLLDFLLQDHTLIMLLQVHVILRLSTLLHKRIIKDMLSATAQSSAPLTSDTAQHLDTLPPQSSALLAASDDLISTMYAPQNQYKIMAELSSFLDVINQLRSSLVLFYQGPASLIEQMAKTNLQGESLKDPKKWFDMCFDQVQKAVESFKSTLDLNTEK
jgi:hypothetical protein